MGRWHAFIKERFQLIPQTIMIVGLTLIAKPKVGLWETLPWVFISLFLFFFLLRVMDEYKDYDKDCIAHPKRPLPRGLISMREMRNLIRLLLLGMLGLSIILGWRLPLSTGLMYGIVTGYLWAMFREFYYLKGFLNKRPLIYALSHQLIVIPLSGFLVAAGGVKSILSINTLLISLVLLGGFFAYEICRKLDPKAHSILKTYSQVYGAIPTAIIASIAALISSLCGYFLGTGLILGPIGFLLLSSLIYYYLKPARFKAAEIISSVNLLACIYSLGMVIT